jgi:hypothetical protein
VATGLVPRFLPADLKDPGDVKLTRDRLWNVLDGKISIANRAL